MTRTPFLSLASWATSVSSPSTAFGRRMAGRGVPGASILEDVDISLRLAFRGVSGKCVEASCRTCQLRRPRILPRTGATARTTVYIRMGEPSGDEVRVTESKFDLGPGATFESGELPVGIWRVSYRITVIVRDPESAYLYWEMTDVGIAAARSRLGPCGADGWCNLRVYDTTGRSFDGTNANDYFDVRVDRNEREYFLMIRRPASSMHVEVGVKTHEGYFQPVARSGVAEFPRNTPSPNTALEWMTVTSDDGPPAAEPYHSRYAGPEHGLPAREGAGYVDVLARRVCAVDAPGCGPLRGECVVERLRNASNPRARVRSHRAVVASRRMALGMARSGLRFTRRVVSLDDASFHWHDGPIPGDLFDPERIAVELLSGNPVVLHADGMEFTVYGTLARDDARHADGGAAACSRHLDHALGSGLHSDDRTPAGDIPSSGPFFRPIAEEKRSQARPEDFLEQGASERWRIGASEQLWLGASRWAAVGASETAFIGASRWWICRRQCVCIHRCERTTWRERAARSKRELAAPAAGPAPARRRNVIRQRRALGRPSRGGGLAVTHGYLALVLHAHLPFVRHPESPSVHGGRGGFSRRSPKRTCRLPFGLRTVGARRHRLPSHPFVQPFASVDDDRRFAERAVRREDRQAHRACRQRG